MTTYPQGFPTGPNDISRVEAAIQMLDTGGIVFALVVDPTPTMPDFVYPEVPEELRGLMCPFVCTDPAMIEAIKNALQASIPALTKSPREGEKPHMATPQPSRLKPGPKPKARR